MNIISQQRSTNLIAGIAAVALAATLLDGAILGGVMLTHGNLTSAAFGGLIALIIAGISLGFVAWLLGLMRAAQTHQWEWLVAVLLLGALGTLIYSLASRQATQRAMTPASM